MLKEKNLCIILQEVLIAAIILLIKYSYYVLVFVDLGY